jgi:hypothetical protein
MTLSLRRLRPALGAVLIGLVVAVAPSAPARANPAHDACWSGRTGWAWNQTVVAGSTRLQHVTLPALQPGDVLRFTATGTIHTGGLSGSHDPNGSSDIAGTYWPVPGFRKYALYGYFNRNHAYFGVGSDSGCITYPAAGSYTDAVYLGVNDGEPGDNTGSFTVTMQVWRNPSVVIDAGFEEQRSRTISTPWSTEGPDLKGIDLGPGQQKSGANNAFIRNYTYNWNALTQRVAVRPNTQYRLQGWFRTSGNYNSAHFGVRSGATGAVVRQLRFGTFTLDGYQPQTIDFNSGNNTSLIVFAGFWGPGYNSLLQLDDINLWQTA